MTFLAEWGDRSQLATIALAASFNLLMVTLGALIGHFICTAAAVQIGEWISAIDGFIWGPPLMILLVGTGLYLTVRTGFVQLLGFRHGFKILRGHFDHAQWIPSTTKATSPAPTVTPMSVLAKAG